jgi:hypothetical protein
MSTYDDIFLRDNFGDTGVVPSTGTPSSSPDIIPRQGETLEFATAESSYAGPDLGMPIHTVGPNNIYLRGFNPGQAASSGTAQLYYGLASLLLLPDQWTGNVVLTADQQDHVTFLDKTASTTIAAGEICLGNPSFFLTGLAPASGDHYCLIAKVDTPNHQTAIPASFDSNATFVAWVQNTPAVAWRNIVVVETGLSEMVTTLTFGNTDPAAAQVHFKVVGRSIPVGSTLSVVCTDQASPFNLNGTFAAPDPSGDQLLGFDVTIPGDFTSAATFTATAPDGQKFSESSEMELSYFQHPPAAMDELTRSVAAPTAIATERPPGRTQVRTDLLVPLGECRIVCGAVSG